MANISFMFGDLQIFPFCNLVKPKGAYKLPSTNPQDDQVK